MGEGGTRLVRIVVDSDTAPRTSEMEQEQRVAIFEIVDEHHFDIADAPGDMALHVRPGGESVTFSATAPDADAPTATFDLHIGAFEPMIRDYHAICAAYFDAVRRLPVSRIEAIDEGRRAIHSTAGEKLVEALAPFAKLDAATGRRLFSLISTLY
jgi:uncharacterized protein (UPF0262 family)